ncbi:fibroblast growth factor receptor substrate 2-like protein [Lates japonicus]|uniref:Fibroblast growth factor receptor substrate 2-like protein n=1 Tax=Lates japonicus TaxID=270547 RepID=A0AAD3NA45_LATJO|nr:fibroblast growth factor receptor substrate 2-like protein [Lates japonicus]
MGQAFRVAVELTARLCVTHTILGVASGGLTCAYRRCGSDSSLFSFEESAVLEPNHQAAHTPAALGYSVPTVPNGVTRIPSVGEVPSHPSTRHQSVASTRLPSVGEESTHPLLVADEAVRDDLICSLCQHHGAPGGPAQPLTVTTPLESPTSPQSQCPPTPPPPPRVRTEPPDAPPQSEPQVLLEPQGVSFALGPTPVQRQLMERRRQQQGRAGHGVKPRAAVRPAPRRLLLLQSSAAPACGHPSHPHRPAECINSSGL